MSWATVEDVLTLTGKTVTEPQLAMAQGMIDIYSNTTEAASGNLRIRDTRYLRMATAYQAAWMLEHPDLFSVTEVSSGSQDGSSFQTSKEDALLLAPLAARCLHRLTWKGPRSVRALPTDQFGNVLGTGQNPSEYAWTRDLEDQDSGSWTPLS